MSLGITIKLSLSYIIISQSFNAAMNILLKWRNIPI